LEGTGAYRSTYALYIQPDEARWGDGLLGGAARADIAARAATADLHNQPPRFTPPAGVVILDAPTTSLRWIDRAGETTVEVLVGSTPPAAVTALVSALRAARQGIASYRVLDAGSFSAI